MNWDKVEGNWKQLKGKVTQKWGKLTQDDLSSLERTDASTMIEIGGGNLDKLTVLADSLRDAASNKGEPA